MQDIILKKILLFRLAKLYHCTLEKSLNLFIQDSFLFCSYICLKSLYENLRGIILVTFDEDPQLNFVKDIGVKVLLFWDYIGDVLIGLSLSLFTDFQACAAGKDTGICSYLPWISSFIS